MADALLMRAKRCSLRLARVLVMAAEEGVEGAPGLIRIARELVLSCAYTTEPPLRPAGVCPLDGDERDVGEAAGRALSSPRVHWLARLMETRLDDLAAGLGLTDCQRQVWTAHVRGETLPAIAEAQGLSLAMAHAHLRRAQARARSSWLAAYLEDLRPRR